MATLLTGNMEFLQWDCDDVASWIESLGFPQYKECFTENFITGRKLIYVISACVRDLLGITETPWSQSIADPPRDTMGLFLEQKSRTGKWADSLSYQQFLADMHQGREEKKK